jgi:flagellar biogenesis protein FliO
MFARSAAQSPPQPKTVVSKIVAALRRVLSVAASGRRERLLRVRETLSLGDKRFIAVVEYGREKFLVAGTPQNISLLQRLDDCAAKLDETLHPESNPE